jgi:hypothetical protein
MRSFEMSLFLQLLGNEKFSLFGNENFQTGKRNKFNYLIFNTHHEINNLLKLRS